MPRSYQEVMEERARTGGSIHDEPPIPWHVVLGVEPSASLSEVEAAMETISKHAAAKDRAGKLRLAMEAFDAAKEDIKKRHSDAPYS